MKRRIPPSRKQVQMTHAAYAPMRASQPSVLENLDQTAHAMERKWGIGKLRLLVAEDLRSRFDAQSEKLNAALKSGQRDLIDVQAEGMKRAWLALDKAAETAGNKTVSAEIWEVRLPKSNRLVAIVRSSDEALCVATPERETWTLQEISHLIEHAGHLVGDIKRTFPDAEITQIHGKTQEPFDWSKGDDIPF